jgi:hypothetical protein
VGALFAASPALAAGTAASASGVAAATVVSPVAVRQIADLDFGLVASNAGSAGEVLIAPGGGQAAYSGSARRGCSGGASCPAPHAASFEVSGEANRTYSIAAPESVSVPGEAASATGGPGTALPQVLQIEAFRFRSVSRPEAGAAGRLDSAGCDRFELGGTLRVPAALPPARYRVTVPVIVAYS